MKRRAFLKNTGLFTAGLTFFPRTGWLNDPQKVRLGIIGTGLRGQNHIDNALRRSDVEIVAISDIDERMLQMTADIFKKAGKPLPTVYTGDPHAYKKMLAQKNL